MSETSTIPSGFQYDIWRQKTIIMRLLMSRFYPLVFIVHYYIFYPRLAVSMVHHTVKRLHSLFVGTTIQIPFDWLIDWDWNWTEWKWHTGLLSKQLQMKHRGKWKDLPQHTLSHAQTTNNLAALVVQQFSVRLVIKRSLVRLLAGVISSQLGQLSLLSLWGR